MLTLSLSLSFLMLLSPSAAHFSSIFIEPLSISQHFDSNSATFHCLSISYKRAYLLAFLDCSLSQVYRTVLAGRVVLLLLPPPPIRKTPEPVDALDDLVRSLHQTFDSSFFCEWLVRVRFSCTWNEIHKQVGQTTNRHLLCVCESVLKSLNLKFLCPTQVKKTS